MNCQVKDCPKHHCYNALCKKHLLQGHESWFCCEECKAIYWQKDFDETKPLPPKSVEEMKERLDQMKSRVGKAV